MRCLPKRVLRWLDPSQYTTLRPRFARELFCFLAPLLLTSLTVQGQAPRLELHRAGPGSIIGLQISGETNQTYLVELSTNLISWQTLAQLQTTNGTATLAFDTSQATHSFLRARSLETNTSVTPESPHESEVSTFIWSDGGEISVITPDMRAITLTIPPGCLVNPTSIRLSLVTNLVGLPFAQGTFGTVSIEPEGLVLSGAAVLSIDYPPGVDSRTVVSFAARNDGSAFGLTVDRPLTNKVIIPVSDLGMYGSAVATFAEVETLVPPSARTAPLSAQSFPAISTFTPTPVEFCRAFHPDDFNVNLTEFPRSSSQCFMPMVERAIAVQQELRAFLICDVLDDLAAVLAWNRLRQIFGQPDHSFTIISNTVKRICPIYQEKIEPLWAEAQQNCALSIVLMRFMLGFERQVQVLGMTNLANCDYTLFSNLDKVCKAAEECIRETRDCCFLGHKGQEKYLEISNIIHQFESIGDTSCFPLGMDDPLVAEALDICLTNTWYGSFKARHYGSSSKTTTSGNTQTVQTEFVEVKFEGGVFASDEQPALPGFGKSIGLRVLGTGTVKVENTLNSVQRTECRLGGTAESRSYYRDLTTGSFTGTNGVQVIWGEYGMGIRIHDDGTTYTITGGGPLLTTTARTEQYHYSSTCEGASRTDYPEPTESQSGALFPILLPVMKPIGADTNIIQGTHRETDTSGENPAINEFVWSFRRVQQR